MSVRSESFTIGTDEYEVAMLDPITAVKLGTRLAKVLGPVLGPILDTPGGLEGFSQKDLNSESFTKAAKLLFEAVDQRLVLEAIETLKPVTTVNNVPLEKIFDIHFRGKIASLVKWLGLCLKAQYGDFSGVLELATVQGTQE